jgi:xylulokinase
LLLAAPRHSRPLLFLPFLEGERVPYWDPTLRGAFLGLDRGHGTGDLAAAVIEGVAFANRVVLERAEAAIGVRAPALRLGGGAAANRRWAQAKADICGRPVLIGSQPESGLLGAGLVAWTGLGRFPSLAAAQNALDGQVQAIMPRRETHDAYDRLFALYKDAIEATRDLSHRLAPIHAPPF